MRIVTSHSNFTHNMHMHGLWDSNSRHQASYKSFYCLTYFRYALFYFWSNSWGPFSTGARHQLVLNVTLQYQVVLPTGTKYTLRNENFYIILISHVSTGRKSVQHVLDEYEGSPYSHVSRYKSIPMLFTATDMRGRYNDIPTNGASV